MKGTLNPPRPRELPIRLGQKRSAARSQSLAPVLAVVLAGAFCGSCEQPQLVSTDEKFETLIAMNQGAEASNPFDRTSSENAFPPPSPALADAEPTPLSLTYPLEFTLENADGRQLAGVVLGKEGEEIAFRRDSDDAESIIALDRLSPASREAISAYPDGELEQLETLRYREAELAATETRRPTLGDNFLETVEEALARTVEPGRGERFVLVSFLGRNVSASGECSSNSGST